MLQGRIITCKNVKNIAKDGSYLVPKIQINENKNTNLFLFLFICILRIKYDASVWVIICTVFNEMVGWNWILV